MRQDTLRFAAQVIGCAPLGDSSLQPARCPVYTCPHGHQLQERETPNRNFQCAVCGVNPPEGATMYGCRLCNYNECVTCASVLDRRVRHPLAAAHHQRPNDAASEDSGLEREYGTEF